MSNENIILIKINNIKLYIREKGKKVKEDIVILILVNRQYKLSWYIKVIISLLIGYALSPIDLIPDFIPIIGYVDDIILLPIGIKIAISLIPKKIINECLKKANDFDMSIIPKSYNAAFFIVIIWILIIYLIAINII